MDFETCERMQDLLRQPIRDNVAGRAAFEALRPMAQQLLEAYAVERGRDGGEFGRRVLELVEARVMAELNGRMELSDRVSLVSCSVHVAALACYVDVRLKVEAL
jgi:hypothetical protein